MADDDDERDYSGAEYRRFFERVYVTEDAGGDGCWLWQGYTDLNGYGRLSFRGITVSAHRLSWDLLIGEPIPDGRLLHHECRRKTCVRPDHLRLLTPAEHGAVHREPTPDRCLHGHDLTDEHNLRIRVNGARVCRACVREHSQRYRARLKQQAERERQGNGSVTAITERPGNTPSRGSDVRSEAA